MENLTIRLKEKKTSSGARLYNPVCMLKIVQSVGLSAFWNKNMCFLFLNLYLYLTFFYYYCLQARRDVSERNNIKVPFCRVTPEALPVRSARERNMSLDLSNFSNCCARKNAVPSVFR